MGNICDIPTALLTLAVKYSSMTSVELFIKCGGNAKAVDSDGFTLLHYAVKNKCLEVVNALIRHGADANVYNSRRQTPLHVSCLYFDKRVMRTLLNNKANIHLRCKLGHTALHLAVISRNTDAVAMVLKHAEKTKKNILPMVWQELSEWNYSPQNSIYSLLVKYIVNRVIAQESKKVDPRLIWKLIIHRLVRKKRVYRLKLLRDYCKSEDISETAPHKDILKTAVCNLSVPIVDMLLEEGASVTSKDSAEGGNIAHDIANLNLQNYENYKKCNRILRSLGKYGCDFEGKNTRGMTALHAAHLCENKPAIRVLLENGADINAEDWKGRPPFFCVTYNYYFEGWTNPSKVNAIFISHILKLKVIDFPISEQNETYFNAIPNLLPGYIQVSTEKINDLVTLRKRCTEELDNMKLAKLMDYPLVKTGYISVYDFTFRCTDKVLLKVATDDDLIEYIESDDFTSKFPLYGFLVHLKLREGILERVALDAKQFLTGLGLPDLCCDLIMKQLDLHDHYAIKRALSQTYR